MTGMMVLFAALVLCAVGGVAFAFLGPSNAAEKRMASIARPTASARLVKGAAAQDNNQQRRKNVQTMLKELEKQTAATK